MQNLKTPKTSDKAKQPRLKNKKRNFLNHSKLVEQELMTSHEYEQMYYKPSYNQAR